jgi:hypothetical protein
MDEVIKQLLESDLLSEEVKASIKEQLELHLVTLKESVEAEVRAELASQWISDRDILVESMDEKITAFLKEGLGELKEDIERFRDLEAEYSEKIVQEKRKLAEDVGTELDTLVEKLDAFLEQRLTEEMEELKEDLEEAKTNIFGRKVFEAFKAEFGASFKEDDDSVYARVDVLESKLADAETQIGKLEVEKNKMVRESKLEEVLSSLEGAKREQMSIILTGVATERLQETFNKFIGKILKEETKAPEVKAKVTLTEDVTKTVVKETTLVTGDAQVVKAEPEQLTESVIARQKMLRLAGVK